MNKYERNIQQIRDRGESAEMYFLDKLQEECVEVIRAVELVKYKKRVYTKEGMLMQIKEFKDFQKERADLKNILTYMDIIYNDLMKISTIQLEKIDRGYERGKNEE